MFILLFHQFDDLNLIQFSYTGFSKLLNHHITATLAFKQQEYQSEVVETYLDDIKTHKVYSELNSYIVFVICHSCH